MRKLIYGENKIYDEQGHEIFKIFHSTVGAGKRIYRNHHHTAFEISVFVNGSGKYRVKDREYSFKKGDVFVFGTDEEHCITDIFDNEEMDLVNIHFEPRFIWSSKNGISNTHLLKIFFNRNRRFSNQFPSENEKTKKIRNLIFEIEKEFDNKKEEYSLMVRIKLVEILICFLRDFDYVNNSNSYPNKEDNLLYLERAMEYIEDNLNEDISLETLSDISKMSRSRFCTVFKKYNGISPWEYITIKRIEKSVELLKNTKMTKLEIALVCGFNNTSNFYRAFKKVTGKIPSDYLKRT